MNPTVTTMLKGCFSTSSEEKTPFTCAALSWWVIDANHVVTGGGGALDYTMDGGVQPTVADPYPFQTKISSPSQKTVVKLQPLPDRNCEKNPMPLRAVHPQYTNCNQFPQSWALKLQSRWKGHNTHLSILLSPSLSQPAHYINQTILQLELCSGTGVPLGTVIRGIGIVI